MPLIPLPIFNKKDKKESTEEILQRLTSEKPEAVPVAETPSRQTQEQEEKRAEKAKHSAKNIDYAQEYKTLTAKGDLYKRQALEADKAIAKTGRNDWMTQSILYADKTKYEQQAQEYYDKAAEARAQGRAANKQESIADYEKYRSDPHFAEGVRLGGHMVTTEKEKADTANKWQNASLQMFTENKADQLSAMSSKELSMYSYLLATQGKDAADEFFGLVEESLNQRIGTKEAEALQESKIGGLAAPIAGFQSAVTGGVQAIGALAGKELPTSSLQYTSQKVRGDLDAVPGALYDVAYTAGNMAPSIAASTMLGGAGVPAKLASAIGSLTLGTSSAGNAYKEGLERGYTQEEAVTYGILNGASEAGMQYFLGGISALGGASGKVAAGLEGALAKVIKNPQVVTAVSNVIASMGAEFAEEYLQEVLSPVWRNIAGGEHSKVDLISGEALYAGILGALTAGLIEGPSMMAGRAVTPSEQVSTAQAATVAPDAQIGAQASAQAENQATGTAQNTSPDIDLPKLEQNPNVTIIGDMAHDTPDGTIGLPRKATAEELAAAKHSAEPIETVEQRNAVTSANMNHFGKLASEVSAMEIDKDKVYTREDLKALANKPASEYTAADVVALTQALGKGGLYGKDVSRVLDKAAGGNREVRNALANLIEKPFNQAGGQYGRRVDYQLTSYDAQMRKLGITPDSKADAAVMKYGEGQYVNEYGDLVSYTLADLQAEFPSTWKNIVEADKLNRSLYDNYLQAINNMRESIYPQALERAQAEVDTAKESYNTLRAQQKNQQRLVEKYGENITANEELLAAKDRKDTQAYTDLQNRIERQKALQKKAQEKLDRYERKIADIEFKIDTLEGAIADGDILRQKKITPRKDYYHHVKEFTSAFDLAGIFSKKGSASELAATRTGAGKESAGGLGGILDKFLTRRGSSEISPSLVGASDYTKPKAKWEGILERREGARAKISAYAGMVDYVSTGEFMLAFDPITAYYRSIDSVMMQAAEKSNSKNSNVFREWLQDWTSVLTGKSDHIIDRGVQKVIGRNILNGMNRLNSIVKASNLIGNVRSSIVQAYALANALNYIPNPTDWKTGMYYMANAARGGIEYVETMRKSDFMSQRNATAARDITPTMQDKLSKPGALMLEAGQKFADHVIWWTAYARYEKNPNAQNAMYRDYSSAVDYADDITRRSVAGRGIGEAPVLLNSKTINMLAPFQTEVLNQYNTLVENLKTVLPGKGTEAQRSRVALGIVEYQIGAFVFNAIARALFGDDVLGFDFLHVLLDSIKDIQDDDEKPGQAIWQNVAGTVLEGIPFVGFLTPLVMDDETSQKLFGADGDPTRYGTGTMGTNAIAKGAAMLFDGKKNNPWEIAEIAANFVPFGGRQIYRTAQGLDTLLKGGSYKDYGTEDERLQYELTPTPENIAKALLFGKWSPDSAREYVDNAFPILDPKDTRAYRLAKEAGIDGTKFLDMRVTIKGYKSDDETTKMQKARELIMKQDLTPEQKTLIDRELLRQGFVADYSSETMFKLSQMGKTVYEKAQENIKGGLTPAEALMVEEYRAKYNGYEPTDDKSSTVQFREALYENDSLTPAQKKMLDEKIIGNQYTPDYSSEDAFTTDSSEYDVKHKWKVQGYSQDEIDTYYEWHQKKNAYEPQKNLAGETVKTSTDLTRAALMADTSLTAQEKAKIDSAVIGNKFTYDYSSRAAYELCEMSGSTGSVYNKAKEINQQDSRITLDQTLLIAKWWAANGTGSDRKERFKSYLFSLGFGKNRVWTVLQAYDYDKY